MKPIPFKNPSTPWRVRVPAKQSDTGKVQIKYFKTKGAANDFIAKFKAEREKHGNQAISPEERAIVSTARAQLGDLQILPEIIQHWMKTGTGAIHKRTVFESIQEFIAWAESQKSTYGKRTLSDIRWRMKDFANYYSDDYLHQIGQKEIQAYLETKPEGWSRKSFFKRLRPFFRWARAQRIIAVNPTDEMQSPNVGYHAPEIYQPDDLEQILYYCEAKKAYDVMPFIIMTAFGFVRTSELVKQYKEEKVLQWEHLLWSESLIHVPHGVAKRTKRDMGDERFIPMTQALIHWLEPLKKDSGPIVNLAPMTFYRHLQNVLDGSGVEAVDNGFRHSCLSFFIGANPDVGIAKAAQYAGNSEGVTRKHYLKTLKPEQARLWWEIRRQPIEAEEEKDS